jgi:hypothetical protein
LPTFADYSGGMWNVRLRKPIHLKDGRTIKTLSDAKYFLLSLPARDQQLQKWQRLSTLLASAAKTNNPKLLSMVTHGLEDALKHPPFTIARLASDDMSVKKPS